MISSDLSAIAKLVVWLINTNVLLRGKFNLGFGLSYFSFLLKILYIHLELSFCTLRLFQFFYPRIINHIYIAISHI